MTGTLNSSFTFCIQARESLAVPVEYTLGRKYVCFLSHADKKIRVGRGQKDFFLGVINELMLDGI